MFHFRCDGCAFAADRDYRPRAYLLEDGREIPMEQRHVWCARCLTVTPAECREPARCLRCGNVDIALARSDWEDLPHPPCGGTLRCTATIVGGTFAPCRPHRYSIEGELIETGCYLAAFIGESDRPLELW